MFVLSCAVLLFALSAGAAEPLGLFEDHGDVGETPRAGSLAFDSSSGVYRVSGGGYDVWFDADAFHFAWRKQSGDFTISADVEFVGEGVETRRKAMLMVRQSLDAGAAYADAALHADGLTALQFRLAAGGETRHVVVSSRGPRRLRLERRGDRFTMSMGESGGKLVVVGTKLVVPADPVYVGFGVSAHNAAELETAVFSNVRIE